LDQELNDHATRLKERKTPLEEKFCKSTKRKRVLDETLRLMVQENKDLIQAKMLALDNEDALLARNMFEWVLRTNILDRQPNRKTRVLRWAYRKLGGK
jgi:hypothetical protein